MTKRLAIQIFGHLRTFDKTYQSFYENVVKVNEKSGYKVDVFMHVWDELEYCEWQWHNDDIPEVRGKKLTEEQILFVREKYKPVKFEFTPQLKTDNQIKYPEFTGGETAYSTMINVWYTKYRVNQLRLEYEKEQNLSYDYVINTRADVFYKSKFVIDEILDVYNNLLKSFDTPDNKLFYSGFHRDLPIKEPMLLAASDVLYFGKPDVMNKVSLIYENLNHDELKNHFMSWEYYLIYTANKNNITPIQLNYALAKDWYIARLRDFKRHKKIFGNKKFSLKVGSKYIQITIFGIFFKFETGSYKK